MRKNVSFIGHFIRARVLPIGPFLHPFLRTLQLFERFARRADGTQCTDQMLFPLLGKFERYV